MKCLSFALAAVAVTVGSGSALAQCNCSRQSVGGRPVQTAAPAYGRPVYTVQPVGPVVVAGPKSCCNGVGTAPSAAPNCHAAGPAAGLNPLAAAPADDKPAGKEVKVTGTLVCGKCNLKETAKCSNVLQVKEGDKVVNYYLTDKGNGETYHEGVCGGDKVENVTIAGKLTEKDGKKWVMPTKVELPKK